jgi:hypothetical protein
VIDHTLASINHILDLNAGLTSILTSKGNEGVLLLWEKIQNLEYIDIAEQAIKTLEKVSHECPGALSETEGLSFMLQFVDFFTDSTQVFLPGVGKYLTRKQC